MKKKFLDKEVKLKLRYLKSECDFERNYFLGGVEEPRYLEELFFDIYDDMEFDIEKEEFRKNGNMVLELAGTSRSLYELGKYLVNIALYETGDDDFHEHLDGLYNSKKTEKINLIVRKNTNM